MPVSGAQQIAAPLSSASGLASVREPLHRHKVTLNYTGAQQTFTVPGLRRLMVTKPLVPAAPRRRPRRLPRRRGKCDDSGDAGRVANHLRWRRRQQRRL